MRVTFFLLSFHYLPLALSFAMQRFTFLGIPFNMGVHHIHSPEHFVAAYGLAPPGFEIVETSPPFLVRNHVVVKFRYKTWFGEGKGSLFTDDWTKSMVSLFKNDQSHGLTCSLSVRQEGTQGYTLELKTCEFGTRSFLEQCACMQMIPHDNNNMKYYNKILPEDFNLHIYRQLVFFGLKNNLLY